MNKPCGSPDVCVRLSWLAAHVVRHFVNWVYPALPSSAKGLSFEMSKCFCNASKNRPNLEHSAVFSVCFSQESQKSVMPFNFWDKRVETDTLQFHGISLVWTLHTIHQRAGKPNVYCLKCVPRNILFELQTVVLKLCILVVICIWCYQRSYG